MLNQSFFSYIKKRIPLYMDLYCQTTLTTD